MNNSESSSARTKRSKIACSGCRMRKVRCDVAHRGTPCTNCFLDHKECEIELAARRNRRAKQGKTHPVLVPDPQSATQTETVQDETANSRDRIDPPREPCQEAAKPVSCDGSPAANTHVLSALLQQHSDPIADEEEPACGPGTSDINFAVYRFIRTDFLLTVQQADIKYLEDQACLRVPRRELMDEMLNQYFRHIHPLLPVLNEAEFWAMYHPVKYRANHSWTRSISLFVLQSMLFACCSFVPAKKLRRLWFNNCQHARKHLYRRAKLLYSLDTDSDPVALSQGALMLSLWCPQENEQQINTWWLTSAIQHARAAQAHRHKYQDKMSYSGQLVLKRLWWSCILRDRIMALCLRQPIHITREMYNFEADRLTVNDIKDDGASPGVYDEEMKRIMLIVTVSMCDLCIVLTDALALVYPQVLPTVRVPEQCSLLALEVQRVRESLDAWYSSMQYHMCVFPVYQRSGGPAILFQNLLQIYFHSTRILLANYEIQMEVEFRPIRIQSQESISRNSTELQQSTIAITELLRQLVRLDLVKYLPISAVSCSAKPLVLYLLDQTLTDAASATAHSKLGVILEAMKVYQCLYDYTDLVLKTAHRISLEARSFTWDDTTVGWADILSQNPKAYLRFIVIMEMAIAKGSFPRDLDLPSTLQPEGGGNRCVEAFSLPATAQSEREADRKTARSSPAAPTACMASPHRSQAETAAVADTNEPQQNDAIVYRPWSGLGSRDPLIMESEVLFQSLLESYLYDDNANTMHSPRDGIYGSLGGVYPVDDSAV